MEERQKAKHSPWIMILIILHMLVLAATLSLNYVAAPMFSVQGLYENDSGVTSYLFCTKITPAGWTFTIWAFIYLWQIVHAIYSLTLQCRKGANGQYLYASPGHIHYSYYITYILNNCANIAWMFTLEASAARYDFRVIAMALLILITLTIYICGLLICKYLRQAEVESPVNIKDIKMSRTFVLNGLVCYGAWCTVASLLNFSIMTQYEADVDSYIRAFVCLGILAAELLVWFALETPLFDTISRYCCLLIIVSVFLVKRSMRGCQRSIRHWQSS